MSTNRRVFMLQVAVAGTALAATRGFAQAAKVSESDPQAVALGYVHDTTKADARKYPKHSKDQKCATCQLYQGKPGAADGPCPLFGGKLVAADGWCSAWVKKA